MALDPKGRVAGYAGMHNIVGKGMSPTWRCILLPEKGIGRALMETLLQFAEENHLRLVTLEVRASNAGAIALYEQLGFVQVGFRPGYYQKPKRGRPDYDQGLLARPGISRTGAWSRVPHASSMKKGRETFEDISH